MSDNTGFAAFALYNAMKLHFTSDSYDYFKYHGKTNISKQSFSTNKNKYHFYRLSRKYSIQELKDLYLANFINGKGDWIGEITGPEGEENYIRWQKINQALTYTFENDIMYLLDKVDKPDDLLLVKSNEFPKLLQYLMSGNISIETVIILNDIMEFIPMWNKQIYDDIVWPSWHRIIKKYTPFIQYDKNKFLHILKKRVREYDEA